MKDFKIYLLGASGHSLSVIDALESNDQYPVGYFDPKASEKINLPHFGKESVEGFQAVNSENSVFFPCIGDNYIRQGLTEFIMDNSDYPFSIIHAKTSISKNALIGPYCFLGAGVIVNSTVVIGSGAIINTGAIIEHECVIGDFAHIGPGAVLCGNVSVGERTFVGANATVRPGIKIGKDAIIGAGAVVVKNVEDNEVHVGAPAKFLKKNGK